MILNSLVDVDVELSIDCLLKPPMAPPTSVNDHDSKPSGSKDTPEYYEY